MTKLFAGLLAIALMIGLGSVPTLTHAEEDTTEEAKTGGSDTAADSTKDESVMEELEDA